MTPLSHLPPGAPWWMFAAVASALALHIGGGSLGIISGYGAITVRKGEHLHRLFGTIFLASMLTMAVMALVLAVWLREKTNINGAALALYFVSTAWMTVRRPEGHLGLFEYAVPLIAGSLAAMMFYWGFSAALRPGNQAATTISVVFGSVTVLAAGLDVKVILQGGSSGTSRIARHLWRMCVALFFAAGSFFLGQQKVMPAFIQGSPILLVAGFAPLVLMAFWLLRVRLLRRAAAMTTSGAG